MATSMSPGDIRTFKHGDGKAVVAGVGLWAEKHGEWIEIHLTGPCRTTVTNNPDSVRYHQTLFRDLRMTLIRERCWSFGDEGAEVEKVESKPRYDPIKLRGEGPSASEIVMRDRERF